ncbi:caspase-1 [Halyomorpha halys]|uniref:caspase-1 n=1 Tax=Halyomorpha halys TaxID=286706 RepID=UPI0006D50734|nr:caspase-1-like [Halyomorpha halys]
MDSSDNAPSLTNGEDVQDAFGFSNPKNKNKNGDAAMVVHKDSLFYKMDHTSAGVAFIFNHEKFIMPHLRDRTGTQEDCSNLRKCFELLGFSVTVYQDLEIKEFMQRIEKIAELDYSDMDCLVICVLSHGESGVIYAKDAAFTHEDLWGPFTADKCKSLAGKPKLFFIQACQGTRLDPGLTLKAEVDSSPSYKIPIHADFLIAYSTIPGPKFRLSERSSKIFQFFKWLPGIIKNRFYSWRNTGKGSWFVQALAIELKENGFRYDILTLLTFVNRRVAVDFESYVPGDRVMHAQKQIPCITTMLTRLLKFQQKK